MDYKERLEEFIITEVCPEMGIDSIDSDEPLIDSGIVDSLGILKILSFIDEEFGVDLSGDEIRPENFSSINKIIGLIKNQREGGI